MRVETTVHNFPLNFSPFDPSHIKINIPEKEAIEYLQNYHYEKEYCVSLVFLVPIQVAARSKA
jgi:hypothetical protein